MKYHYCIMVSAFDSNTHMNDYTLGWEAAHAAHVAGVDVRTHASQGDTDWDCGWNAYLDMLEVTSK